MVPAASALWLPGSFFCERVEGLLHVCGGHVDSMFVMLCMVSVRMNNDRWVCLFDAYIGLYYSLFISY